MLDGTPGQVPEVGLARPSGAPAGSAPKTRERRQESIRKKTTSAVSSLRSGARRRFAAPPPQGARARTLYVPRGGGERGAGRRLLHRVVRQLLAGGRPVVTVRPRSISLSDTPASHNHSLTNAQVQIGGSRRRRRKHGRPTARNPLLSGSGPSRTTG